MIMKMGLMMCIVSTVNIAMASEMDDFVSKTRYMLALNIVKHDVISGTAGLIKKGELRLREPLPFCDEIGGKRWLWERICSYAIEFFVYYPFFENDEFINFVLLFKEIHDKRLSKNVDVISIYIAMLQTELNPEIEKFDIFKKH